MYKSQIKWVKVHATYNLECVFTLYFISYFIILFLSLFLIIRHHNHDGEVESCIHTCINFTSLHPTLPPCHSTVIFQITSESTVNIPVVISGKLKGFAIEMMTYFFLVLLVVSPADRTRKLIYYIRNWYKITGIYSHPSVSYSVINKLL